MAINNNHTVWGDYLDQLESESIHIMREVAGQFERPALLFSGGKDSIVMVHLALKAFRPGKFPFPLVHIDTGHNFQEALDFRDLLAETIGEKLIVRKVADTINAKGLTEQKGKFASRNALQTFTLLDTIEEFKFDACIGGARRDEEKARAKERIFSVRDEFGQWDPKLQRPELWNTYNGRMRREPPRGGAAGGLGPGQAGRGARRRRRHRRDRVPRARRRHRADGRAVRCRLQHRPDRRPGAGSGRRPGLQPVGGRAVPDEPEPAGGLAIAPILGDIDGAVKEITRARESGLWGGVIIGAQWTGYPSYTDYKYDPIWAVCQDLEMPLHTHSGPGAMEDYGAVPGVLGLYASETVWWTARPMWFLLWSGVFERFPRLKMAVTESGSFWVPDLLWRWDSLVMRDQGSRKLGEGVWGLLKMKPSEYFDRNVNIGSSNTRRRELAKRYEIGVGNIMWGNDFPHPEGTWPYTRKILREAFWDIPIDETERILGLNAAEFYGFDLAAVQPIADRIGPTPEDLGQTDPSATDKWSGLKAAGRHWLTGQEAVPAAVDPGH